MAGQFANGRDRAFSCARKRESRSANYERFRSTTVWRSRGERCAAPGVDVYLRRRAMAAQDGSASAIYSTRETGTAPARLARELNGCENPSGIILRLLLPLRLRLVSSRVSPPRDTLSSRFRINFERCRSSG